MRKLHQIRIRISTKDKVRSIRSGNESLKSDDSVVDFLFDKVRNRKKTLTDKSFSYKPMDKKSKVTLIKISRRNARKLKRGLDDEMTYDEILLRLIKKWETNTKTLTNG